MENLEIDAGITYLDHEPLGRATTVPLYQERYLLVISNEHELSTHQTVSWQAVSKLPLCLLTLEMQNRRIINQHLAEAGTSAAPTLESDSIIALFSHVRAGKWASIMPVKLTETFGPWEDIRTVPIVEPDTSHLVGLVAAHREPHTPTISALIQQAKDISQLPEAD